MAFREGGKVASVVGKATHVGGEGIASKVAGVVGKDTNVCRDIRDGGKVVKVVVVARGGYWCEVGSTVKVAIIAGSGYRREVGSIKDLRLAGGGIPV